MTGWRRTLTALLTAGDPSDRDHLDALLTGWLFHLHRHDPASLEFVRANVAVGRPAVAAHRAALRWLERAEMSGELAFEDPGNPRVSPWGVVTKSRHIADGVGRIHTLRRSGILLSAGRERLLHSSLRRPGGWHVDGLEADSVVVSFPFLAWAARGSAFESVYRALSRLRTGLPAAYQEITGLWPGRVEPIRGGRSQREARRLLEKIEAEGFDGEAYRRAVRKWALTGRRKGADDVARNHPANWLEGVDEAVLEALIEVIWAEDSGGWREPLLRSASP